VLALESGTVAKHEPRAESVLLGSVNIFSHSQLWLAIIPEPSTRDPLNVQLKV